MRVEKRKGRPYLYDRKRVGGRLVCEYLGPLSPAEERHFRGRAEADRAVRDAERAERADELAQAANVLAAGAAFDRLADRAFRAVMLLTGHTLHKRGEWRRKRGITMGRLDDVTAAGDGHRPALIPPPAMRPEDQAVLERAARGDWSALPAVKQLLCDPVYLDAVGGAGTMALTALIVAAAGSNVAVAEAMRQKHGEYVERLLADGPPPTFGERLAATRAAHNWLAVNVLECMAALKPAAGPQAVALERRVTQAERRLHLSLRSLATLRRLRRQPRLTSAAAKEGAA